MKYIIIAVIAMLLGTNHVSAQTTKTLTGSDIPDAAAWRVWLNQKSEVPGDHSEAFTTYLISLGLSQGDAAVLQTALESYATQETQLRAVSNAKIDAADENLDGATASNLQTAFQTKLAALVSATQAQLASRLSTNGGAFLSHFIQLEKKHMTISPVDVTLARTVPTTHAEFVSYHVHSSPQGTQMTYGYSTYASGWLSLSGLNSSGEPYGTFYQQIGAQGSTSPCTGQCLSAYHSVVTEYNHAAGGNLRYTVADQHPNTAINGNYTYSWAYDATTNNYWNSETAWVYVQCTIAGIFLDNNPIGGGDPFASEVARTYTTTPGQVVLTCNSDPYCPYATSPSTYCSATPDYKPSSASFDIANGASVVEFRQYAACWRPVSPSGLSWSCSPQYSEDQLYSATLIPSAGGASCTHHP